ncbi:MAG: YkvA family protein [Candidatus Heimdallarchaeaceae archaeon]
MQVLKLIEKWKNWAYKLKKETYTLYLVYRDPRVSFFKKLFLFIVVAYAFSPIDLIPDFIPLLGYLDDLIIVPLGVFIAMKIIPKDVYLDCKKRATEEFRNNEMSSFKLIGIIIVIIWLTILGLIAYYFWKLFQ